MEEEYLNPCEHCLLANPFSISGIGFALFCKISNPFLGTPHIIDPSICLDRIPDPRLDLDPESLFKRLDTLPEAM